MVRTVEESAAERALKNTYAWIPTRLRSYAIPLAALTLLSSATYPFVTGAARLAGAAGRRYHAPLFAGAVRVLVLGYGAGVMTGR